MGSTEIYVGGAFITAYDSIGTKNATRIAKYNGASWSILGNTGVGVTTPPNNGTNGIVNTIALLGSDIYIGGEFTVVYDSGGTKNANYIAKYNGTWSLPGTSTNGTTTDNGTNYIVNVIYINKYIYIGGHFTTAYNENSNINGIASRIYIL